MLKILPYSPTLYLEDSYVGQFKIYTLRNPFTKEIFYVGQTMQALNTRLSGHIGETGANREKIAYIKEIVNRGQKPIIEAIEVVATTCYIDRVMVNQRELYWIKYYKDLGCNLLNKSGIDSDGTYRIYSGYLASLKRGETMWHYYYCGKTAGGYEVYDETKLKADGFRLPIPVEPVSKKGYESPSYSPFDNNRFWERLGYPPEESGLKPKVTTEIFPPQPSWSAEFLNGIPYDENDEYTVWDELAEMTEDYDNEGEEEEVDLSDYEPDTDCEPDSDEEPDEDD